MTKVQGTGTFNRREFLELGLASTLLPGMSAGTNEDREKIATHTPIWMDEWPFVMSMTTWSPPLYMRRQGGYPQWQEELWHREFTEEGAREMKEAGVTVNVAIAFQGFGLDVERSVIDEAKKGAVFWRQYGIKVGAYIGSTLHYETFFLEK